MTLEHTVQEETPYKGNDGALLLILTVYPVPVSDGGW